MRWFTVLILLIISGSNLAQSKSKINLEVIPVENVSLPQQPPHLETFITEFELRQSLKEYIGRLHENGYLSASVDSITGDTINKKAYVFLGNRFEWTALQTDSVDEEIISRTGFRDKLFLNQPFNPKQISRFFEEVLTYLENHGYPFAQIRLSHVQIQENEVAARVQIDRNQFYKIDTVIIQGDSLNLNRHYIENIIQLRAGLPYEERVITQIGRRIAENPFMDELLPFEVLFTESQCKVVLTLKPKKANTFDGVLGIQPQPDDEGVVLTGDIKLGLGNLIGQGEKINLRWQRLQNQTQEINGRVDVPFFFRTPIGFGYQLDIYRQDTTFNNVSQHFIIPFRLFNGTSFRAFYQQFSTTLISTADYQNSTEIPPFNDAKNFLYGVGYQALLVENIRNPYKGWTIDIEGGAGQNRIIRNSSLEQVNYDSVELESGITQGMARIEYFQPVTKKTTLLFRVNAATQRSVNLVENQVFRIGGLLSIRGFDEQSILASSYVIGTLEYRFLIDQNARISVFYDIGWYEKVSISDFVSDTPYGFGAGISFGTGAGMFSLNYALGRQFNNPVDFRTGKIHFGFVNFF